jgi:hypothetical protein
LTFRLRSSATTRSAPAVLADMVSAIGTTGTGFLQNDARWRSLECLPPSELRPPHYARLEVDDRVGVLAGFALRLAAQHVSVARLVQPQGDATATLHALTHESPAGRLEAALDEIAGLPETRAAPTSLPITSDRGVAALGWA